jgi:IMP cyclohydrolase
MDDASHPPTVVSSHRRRQGGGLRILLAVVATLACVTVAASAAFIAYTINNAFNRRDCLALLSVQVQKDDYLHQTRLAQIGQNPAQVLTENKAYVSYLQHEHLSQACP